MASVLFRGKENRDITGGMGAMYMDEPEEGYNAAQRTETTFPSAPKSDMPYLFSHIGVCARSSHYAFISFLMGKKLDNSEASLKTSSNIPTVNMLSVI